MSAPPTTAASRQSLHLHYWLNRLQPLPFAQDVIVSLNPVRGIDPARIIGEVRLRASGVRPGAIPAPAWSSCRGQPPPSWYCGAWTGYGFHGTGSGPGWRGGRRCPAPEDPGGRRREVPPAPTRQSPSLPLLGFGRVFPARLRRAATLPTTAFLLLPCAPWRGPATAARSYYNRRARRSASATATTATAADGLWAGALANSISCCARGHHRRRQRGLAAGLSAHARAHLQSRSASGTASGPAAACAPSSPRSTTPSASATATCSTVRLRDQVAGAEGLPRPLLRAERYATASLPQPGASAGGAGAGSTMRRSPVPAAHQRRRPVKPVTHAPACAACCWSTCHDC